MKNFLITSGAFAMLLSLSGCGLIEDGFKAGIIFTIIIVAIIGAIIWAVRFTAKVIGKKYIVQLIPVKQHTRSERRIN